MPLKNVAPQAEKPIAPQPLPVAGDGEAPCTPTAAAALVTPSCDVARAAGALRALYDVVVEAKRWSLVSGAEFTTACRLIKQGWRLQSDPHAEHARVASEATALMSVLNRRMEEHAATCARMKVSVYPSQNVLADNGRAAIPGRRLLSAEERTASDVLRLRRRQRQREKRRAASDARASSPEVIREVAEIDALIATMPGQWVAEESAVAVRPPTASRGETESRRAPTQRNMTQRLATRSALCGTQSRTKRTSDRITARAIGSRPGRIESTTKRGSDV